MDVYDPVRERFARRLGEVSRGWRQMVDRELRRHGMTMAQWQVLNTLDRHGDGQVQREIAMHIGIEGPTLVRLLDRLANAGLIERRAVDHDRRYKTVHLTETARQRLRESQLILEQVRGQILHGVDEDDLTTCLHVFDRMLEQINEASVLK